MSQTPLPVVPDALAARGVSLRLRRDGDAEDAAFLRAVYFAYRWDEVAASGWPEADRIAFLDQQYAYQCAHYDSHYSGAAWGIVDVAGERAGRLYLHYWNDDLRVVDLALMPPYRNQGLGGGLLTAVHDLARSLGATQTSIHVEQYNPALRLYERLGFQRRELRGVYYLLEWPV
jgi:GNAT superfamily N-acetyltransferase